MFRHPDISLYHHLAQSFKMQANIFFYFLNFQSFLKHFCSNLEIRRRFVSNCCYVTILYTKSFCYHVPFLLACLFRRKSQAIVIARSSSLLLSFFKNFNVAHYSKNIKNINSKLGILAHHDKVQLQGKGHNFESYRFGVMCLCN